MTIQNNAIGHPHIWLDNTGEKEVIKFSFL